MNSTTLVWNFLHYIHGSLLASWKFTHWNHLTRSFNLDLKKKTHKIKVCITFHLGVSLNIWIFSLRPSGHPGTLIKRMEEKVFCCSSVFFCWANHRGEITAQGHLADQKIEIKSCLAERQCWYFKLQIALLHAFCLDLDFYLFPLDNIDKFLLLTMRFCYSPLFCST